MRHRQSLQVSALLAEKSIRRMLCVHVFANPNNYQVDILFAACPLKLATVVEIDDAASPIPTSVSTFSGKVATVVEIDEAASSIPTTVDTFSGKVATVVGFHDATSSISTTVANFGGLASWRLNREVWFY